MTLFLSALLLTFSFLSPQKQTDPPIKIKCVMVNVFPWRLVCDDKDKTELEFQIGEFPEAWSVPKLGSAYKAEIEGDHWYAVTTPAEPPKEMPRRDPGYRIPALQANRSVEITKPN